MHLQLAWRNIWRNPRRTAVILLAIVLGVWFMVFSAALMRGIALGMVENGLNTLTGHVQIHYKGYRNDPVVEKSIIHPESIKAAIKKHLPPGAQLTTRVRVNSIANNARHSSGVTLVGIGPEKEAKVSFIGKAVTQGRYLESGDDKGILVGQALLDKFETKLGNKIILMSQDKEGDIASKAFRIVGVFKAEMGATEKQFVFVGKSKAQQMLKLDKGFSEIAITLPDQTQSNQVANRLRNELPSAEYEVHSWQELLPLLVVYLEIYDQFIFIWYLVVFVAMSFGIVNTLLMAVFERIREFGLFKALGMKPWWIIKDVLTESFFLLLIGMVVGNILSFISVFALADTGIDLSAFAAGMEYAMMSRIIYPAITLSDLTMSNLVVLILGFFVSLYPAVKAARFTPVEALTHI